MKTIPARDPQTPAALPAWTLNRCLAGIHLVSLAISVMGLLALCSRHVIFNRDATILLAAWGVAIFAAAAALAGIALMARAKPGRESMMLAVSTVAAFLLLILSPAVVVV
jgi:hypothetical protein